MSLASVDVRPASDNFSDDVRRRLSELRAKLFVNDPVLESGVESEIEDRGGGYHILHFRLHDRECVVESGDGIVYAAFVWENNPLFANQFQETTSLSKLLKRWVADRAMPSEIRREFPDIEIDGLADYYERGVPLEGEFVRSWDAMEMFFREDGGDFFENARDFIRTLREAGYDRVLRAGQSMSIMGLSRSHEQGLSDDQPRLWFAFNRDDMDVDANYGLGHLKGHPIELTDEVRALLDILAKQEFE